MIQFINEPTHFTENSSSCIDLISSTDPNVIDLIHVGQPFLNVNVRYHCPIYGIFKVPKTLHTCFKRRIWLYDRGNLIYIVKNCSVSTGMNLLILEIA